MNGGQVGETNVAAVGGAERQITQPSAWMAAVIGDRGGYSDLVFRKLVRQLIKA
jgi:hypothetical protein